MQKAKPGDRVMGKCRDCGKPILHRENYIVRPEVWSEAGLDGYFGSGFLHEACLEKRLGRRLVKDDFFAWVVASKANHVEMAITPEGREYVLRMTRQAQQKIA